MANNGQRRFCQDCGMQLHAGHSRVCQGKPQVPAVGQQQRQNQPDFSGQITALVRRVQALESARVLNPTPGGLAQLFVRHPRQPQNTVNRVFTASVGTVTTNATTTWARVGELDINDQMTGFSQWAAPFVRVSITSVVVTYTGGAFGGFGSGVVALGFDVASVGQGTAANIVTMDRKVFGPMTASTSELFVHYEERTPFERWLKGAQSSHVPREFGRVFLMRSARQWVNPAGQGVNIDAGFVHVHVQCACLRPPV